MSGFVVLTGLSYDDEENGVGGVEKPFVEQKTTRVHAAKLLMFFT